MKEIITICHLYSNKNIIPPVPIKANKTLTQAIHVALANNPDIKVEIKAIKPAEDSFI